MVEAIVEFDYKAERPDELTLSKGDIIRNIVQQEGGWWTGSLNGRKGVFPDNFVRLLAEKKKRRKCIVLFSYSPANPDELELQVDQEIEILEEVEEGWWKGRLENKTGVFPSNFVKVIPDEPVKKSERIQEVKLESTKDKKIPSKVPAFKPSAANGPEMCRATFAYTALNNDELNLQVGDLVTVLTKDTQEPGWWKGEINGRVGVFPDNFVELVTDGYASVKRNGSDAKKKEPEPEAPAVEAPPAANKHPPLLPKKPMAPPPAQDAPDSKKPPAPEPKIVPEPQISLPETKLVPPAETKSTPPAAVEAKGDKSDFDSVPRADLLPQLLRPKAPRRRPPSAVLKQNGHSDSFEDKTDAADIEPNNRISAEMKPIVPKPEPVTPPTKVEEPPKEALREPTKIEIKKSPFMDELKGAVNQVKKDKPPAKPRPLSIGLTAKAPPTSPRKSPTLEKKPERPISVEKPAPERPVAEKPALVKPTPTPPPVVEELKPVPPEQPKKVSIKALSLEERVKDLEETVRRLAAALREETRNRLRLEEEVEKLVNRVVQI